MRRRAARAGTVSDGRPVAEEGVVAAREPVAGERVAARDPAVVDAAPVRRRRRFAAVSSGALALARIVRLITAAVLFVILLAIALVLLDANAGNSIVSTVHDAGSFLVGPFKDVFTDKDPKVSIAENWGIAAILYLAVGSFIASAIARLGAPRERA